MAEVGKYYKTKKKKLKIILKEKAKFKFVHLDMACFLLHCSCGTITSYGSLFNTTWNKNTTFTCRNCGHKYIAIIMLKCRKVK